MTTSSGFGPKQIPILGALRYDHPERGEQSKQAYRQLRRTVGLLGITLPFILALGVVLRTGSWQPLTSISAYYGSNMGDWFVGVVCTLGFFFFAYRGPGGQDHFLADLTGLCALGVALVPTTLDSTRLAHVSFALGMFLLLAVFCIRRFRKCDAKDAPPWFWPPEGKATTPEKKAENRTYWRCGWTIVGCIALIGVWWLVGRGTGDWVRILADIRPIFWLEAFALLAFGHAWRVKGRAEPA